MVFRTKGASQHRATRASRLGLVSFLLWTMWRLFLGQFACTVDVARNFIHFGQSIFVIVLEGHVAQEYQTLLESRSSLL